jgi:hypothetical protein
MMRAVRWTVWFITVSALATGSACDSRGSGEGIDWDGDCITDELEGRRERVDTDGDGRLDFADLDSDNDGINDRTESLNHSCLVHREPADSDGDGVPNTRDNDSDNNGLDDRHETTGDVDDDGLPDFADGDDDGDLIDDTVELGLEAGQPRDTDGDGHPDYQDEDSDDDTILDREETTADVDGDGRPNYRDDDSDDDGLTDRQEAGDGLLETPARNSDDDERPDFRDVDADNDGLRDDWEQAHFPDIGSDPYRADTDGDEVIDWIEVATGTDAANETETPAGRGYLVFVVPYGEPPRPEQDVLSFSTAWRQVDTFFLLDRTESMQVEMQTVRNGLTRLAMTATCGPEEPPPGGTSSCIPDFWVGFGWLSDPYGVGPDQRTVEVSRNVTHDVASVVQAMPTSTVVGRHEAQRRAIHCSLVGPADPLCPEAITRNEDSYPCPDEEAIGLPCFRPDAVRLLLLITDEPFEPADEEPTLTAVAEELNEAGVTFLGINAERGAAPAVTEDLTSLAELTQSANSDGQPLVFEGTDYAVIDTVTDALQQAASTPSDVTLTAVHEPGESGEVTAALLDSFQVHRPTAASNCNLWELVADENGDGFEDAYLQVEPGVRLCWKLNVASNLLVPATEPPQAFPVELEVRRGRSGALLDQRRVFFLVPPEIGVAYR